MHCAYDAAALVLLIPKRVCLSQLVAQCTGGLVRKEEATRVLIKARSYLKAKRELEDLYMEHDKDQSGSVTKDELLPMMKASVSGVKGLDPSLVNEDDVDELWEMSDTDGNGSITKAELLLSLSTWRDRMKLAYQPPKKEVAQKKSSACVLL